VTARKLGAKTRIDFAKIPGFSGLSRADKRKFYSLYHHHGAYTVQEFRARRGYAGRGVDSNGVPTTVDADLRRAYRHYLGHGGSRTWESWLRRRELASLSPEDKARAILERKGLAK
jgi:hypothetical protein